MTANNEVRQELATIQFANDTEDMTKGAATGKMPGV